MVLRVIEKQYHIVGKKYRLHTSTVIKEIDISHLETVEQEREVVTTYEYFGIQEDIDIVIQNCYLSGDIYSLIQKEKELLNISDSDLFFASKNLIATLKQNPS